MNFRPTMGGPLLLALILAVWILPLLWRLALLALAGLTYYRYSTSIFRPYYALLLPLLAFLPDWRHRLLAVTAWALLACLAENGLPPLDWASGLPLV